MNIDDFTEIIQEACNDNNKGVIVITLDKEGVFRASTHGNITYIEEVGMLESVKHDLISMSGENNEYIL